METSPYGVLCLIHVQVQHVLGDLKVDIQLDSFFFFA